MCKKMNLSLGEQKSNQFGMTGSTSSYECHQCLFTLLVDVNICYGTSMRQLKVLANKISLYVCVCLYLYCLVCVTFCVCQDIKSLHCRNKDNNLSHHWSCTHLLDLWLC